MNNIFLISFNYFIIGLLSLTSVTFTFFYKETGLSSEQLISLGIWTSLPWTIKILFGTIIDSIGSNRKYYTYLGTALMSASMLGYAHYPEIPLDPWNKLLLLGFTNSLGVVLTDIVTDTFQVEAVEKKYYNRTQYWSQMGQTIGLVAGAAGTGYLASNYEKTTLFGYISILPILIAVSTSLIKAPERITNAINWRLIGISALIIPVALVGNTELLLVGMLFYVGYFMYKVCPLNKTFLMTCLGIFFFRLYPSTGPAGSWWGIDVLKFDATFLGNLTLTARIASLVMLGLVGRFITKGKVRLTLGIITGITLFLSLPELAIFHGIIPVEYAKSVVLGSVILDAPLGGISMVVLGIVIANYAPRTGRATYMSVLASFMNLALMGGDLVSKWLNKIYVVEQGEYSQYGNLLLACIIIGLVLSLVGVSLIREKK